MNNEPLKWIPLSERMPTQEEKPCWLLTKRKQMKEVLFEGDFYLPEYSHFCPIPQPPPLPTKAEEAKKDVERCMERCMEKFILDHPRYMAISSEHTILKTGMEYGIQWQAAQKPPTQLPGVKEIAEKMRKLKRIADGNVGIFYAFELEPLFRQLEVLDLTNEKDFKQAGVRAAKNLVEQLPSPTYSYVIFLGEDGKKYAPKLKGDELLRDDGSWTSVKLDEPFHENLIYRRKIDPLAGFEIVPEGEIILKGDEATRDGINWEACVATLGLKTSFCPHNCGKGYPCFLAFRMPITKQQEHHPFGCSCVPCLKQEQQEQPTQREVGDYKSALIQLANAAACVVGSYDFPTSEPFETSIALLKAELRKVRPLLDDFEKGQQ